MHGIKVLMAKNYIDNLSEETRKGMTEKAEQGLWPSNAPLGYRNVTGTDGKKDHCARREHRANHSKLVRMVRSRGHFDSRSDEEGAGRWSGFPEELWPDPGEHIQGSCGTESIQADSTGTANISRAAQAHHFRRPLGAGSACSGRATARRSRTRKRDFAFSGLIECGACGCAIVGEIKKERYVYYHCTGYADKCRGNSATCRRKHMRQEALEEQFTAILGRLHFDDEVLEWVRDALHASHAEERREHEEAIRRLEAECKRLDDRVHAMYVDKIDGLI